MAEEEKIYTIPLGDAYKAPRPVRARKAMTYLKIYLKKHLKTDVVIGPGLNHEIWSRGIKKPPKKVKVIVFKEEEKFRAELFGYKPKVIEEKKKPKSKKEKIKEKITKKKTKEKEAKEEPKSEEKKVKEKSKLEEEPDKKENKKAEPKQAKPESKAEPKSEPEANPIEEEKKGETEKKEEKGEK